MIKLAQDGEEIRGGIEIGVRKILLQQLQLVMSAARCVKVPGVLVTKRMHKNIWRQKLHPQ